MCPLINIPKKMKITNQRLQGNGTIGQISMRLNNNERTEQNQSAIENISFELFISTGRHHFNYIPYH